MISERFREVTKALEEVRAEQRGLLAEASSDELGPRTMTDVRGAEFDLLDLKAKNLARQLVVLREQLEAEAATAKPPRSSFDV